MRVSNKYIIKGLLNHTGNEISRYHCYGYVECWLLECRIMPSGRNMEGTLKMTVQNLSE